MSDQAEAPPKKVGSLRDRIAAFEKAGAGGSAPAPAPPAPRPKPAGFSNWKPRPPSPPSGEPSQSAAPAKPSAGLSATDAKESVKGQSLKERMAALQGKGGFGGAPPVAPKPALEKPKWKPPPVIAAPKDDDDEEDQPRKPLNLEGIVRSPPAAESDPKNETDGGDGEVKESGEGEGGEGVEPDPEEEERQRRAAIAARMARLGGARVGMAAPPVFGKRPPPPPKKRSSVGEEVAHKEAVTSPKLQATSPEAVTSETVTSALSSPLSEVAAEASPPTQARRSSEAGSSVDSSDPHQAARSPPVSMPVPAAPRRAAPPRKKPAKPSGPPPPVPEAEQEAQEAAPPSADIKPSEELPTSTSTTVASTVVPPKEALVTPLPPTPAANEEDAPPLNIESSEPIKAAEATPAELETGEDAGDAVDTPIAARSQSPEPEREAKPEEKVEEKIEEEPEVDEETKRRQVAERIAKMGGVNPFAAPVLPRRQSSKVLEERVLSPPADFKEDDSPKASLQDDRPSVVPEQPVSPPVTSNSRRSSKLSETPLSPPLRDVGKEQPSTGSVATAQAPILPQQVAPEEPLPINDGEEAATEDDKVREKVKPQSPADRPVVTKPETLEEKEAPPKGQAEVEVEAEADDDSEYSDEDEGVVAAQEHTPAPAHSEVEPIVPARVAEPVPEATAASPPPVQHSPEVPHRSAPPPPPPAPVEDEEELMSEEENEDMAHSRILDLPNKDKADTDIAPITRRETGLSLRSEEKDVASDDSVSEYESQQEEEEEEVIAPVASPPPDAQTAVRNPAPSFVPPPPPPGRPNLPFRSPPPANRALPPAPSAPIPIPSQPAFDVPAPVEVLDDEEGDPIDPTFYSPSRRASQLPTSPDATTTAHDVPAPPESESTQIDAPSESQEDAEAARRRTIAERMAKLGGIKFGAAPPIPGLPKRAPPPPQHQEEERETEEPAVAKGSAQPGVDEEEEEERARKERIAAKLAGMGGMRIGMMPSAFPPRKSHVLSEEPAPPAPPPRAPPARAPPPPQAHESESEVEGSTVSEDAVKVEAEDSDLEEVHYTDAEEEPAPPPIPSRSARPIRRESAETAPPPPHPSSPPTRPPVPTGLPPRRPSTKSVSSQRRVSGESSVSSPPQRRPSLPKPQPSDYVMVEEPQGYEEEEEAPPPPPARPAGGPTRRPSAPPTRLPPPPQQEDSISSQWELPAIPTSNLEIGGSDLEMSWTEAEVPREEPSVTPSASTHGRQSFTQAHSQPPPLHAAPTKSAPPAHDLQLSADDLMALWGRVGVQVCEAATNLFERSKKGLVGDGTYPGFIHAVIHEVPNAVLTENYGYMIYKQSGGAVQKRASDILPGDLVELHDAKFKGHKGLQAYHQNVGADEAVVGVAGEFDAKKSKIKVFQANQHVGQQTVESVSYRLEDMKSGTVKVFRVLEAQ